MSSRLRPTAHYELRARIAKALGHPGRLMILDVLGQRGEASVGELTELLEVDQSTMSRHLSLLRRIGLITSRREGTSLRYRVRVKCLDGFWQCVEGVLAQQVADHEDALAPAPERVALVRLETLVPAREKGRAGPQRPSGSQARTKTPSPKKPSPKKRSPKTSSQKQSSPKKPGSKSRARSGR